MLMPEASWRWHHRLAASVAGHFCPAAGVGAAAALVSAVAGVEFFGLFAPVGLVANLLLAPIASLVIVSGFASLVAGLARASLASRLFNGASGLMLALIGAILRFVTRLPGAWVPCHYRATWIGPAALAALIGACMAGYAAGWRPGRGGFWPPFAIVALTFAVGVKFG